MIKKISKNLRRMLYTPMIVLTAMYLLMAITGIAVVYAALIVLSIPLYVLEKGVYELDRKVWNGED